jgi:hypothetical protein
LAGSAASRASATAPPALAADESLSSTRLERSEAHGKVEEEGGVTAVAWSAGALLGACATEGRGAAQAAAAAAALSRDAAAALVMCSAGKSSAVHALDRKLKLVVAPGGAARALLLALGVLHVYARAEKRRRARGPRQACCAAGARRVVGHAGPSPAESRLGGAPPRRPQRRAREAPGLGAQL